MLDLMDKYVIEYIGEYGKELVEVKPIPTEIIW
jgi:hypothetical protein